MTKRSTTAALLFVAAMMVASFGMAGESQNNDRQAFAEAAATAARSPLMPVSLSALFTAMADNFTIHADGHMSADQHAPTDVMIARVNADGTTETACVATEAAALKFFANRDNVENARMQEK